MKGCIPETRFTTGKGGGTVVGSKQLRSQKKANVKQLVITHHDPDHNDEFLKAQERKSKDMFENVSFARDKMEIEI